MDSTKPYRIVISGGEIFLEYKDSQINNLISINIDKNLVKQESISYLQNVIIYKVIYTDAILGIININNLNFILYVKSSKEVGKIKNEIIYRIEEVDFCPTKNIELLSDDEKKIEQLKDGIAKLLKLGFYYSFGYNLTNSLQNQGKITYNQKNNIPLTNILDKMKYIYQTMNKKYFFNYNLYKRFINKETKKPFDFTYNFIIPIICGYVGMFNYTINQKQI